VLQLSLPTSDGRGSSGWAGLSEVVDRIRSAGCDAILSLGSRPRLDRSMLCGDGWSTLGVELVSFDCRLAAARSDEKAWASSLREAAVVLAEGGAELEVRCADPQDVKAVLELRDEGLLAGPLRFQLLIDTQGRDDSPVEQLARLTESIPSGAVWSASAVGLGQLPANVYALVAGGHLRTGLEDNLWLVEDVAATDEQLVQRLVRIIDEFDRPLATPEEAREIVQLAGHVGLVEDDAGRTRSHAVSVAARA
jgi:3-keto-5-aminohexanoate cleavage enzyme